MKIFGIGLPKTGTTSLSSALRILGYKSKHFAPEIVSRCWFSEGGSFYGERLNFTLKNRFKTIDDHDAIVDTPIWMPAIFKELDIRYPNSKYILTIRNKESWLKSIEKHIGQEKYKKIYAERFQHIENFNPEEDKIYTCDSVGLLEYILKSPYEKFSRTIYENLYNSHYEEVNKYFCSRKEDILVIDICKEDSWLKLCEFLKLDIPKAKFPHLNQAESRGKIYSSKYQDFYSKLVSRYHHARTIGPLSKNFWMGEA